MTYTPTYTYTQCIHISPCYRCLSSAAGVIGNIGLGLANQGTSDKAQDPLPRNRNRNRSSVGICHTRTFFRLAPTQSRAQERAVRTLDQALHHPPPTRPHARARHYHQLDRCHRRRPKTIIHHRPTLTSSLSSEPLFTPHTHTHHLRCAFAAPTHLTASTQPDAAANDYRVHKG